MIVATLLTLAIVAAHVVGFGMLLLKLSRLSVCDLPTRCAIVGGAGFAALGFEMWALGYVNGWYWQSLCWSAVLLGLVCVALLVPTRRSQAVAWRQLVKQAGQLDKLQLALAGLAAATILAAIISGLRPPLMRDEQDYHWPAPLFWAASHHWIVSDYRLTNGPVLIELLYTIAALFHTFIGGHWIHTAIWLVLLCACVGLGRLITIPALPVLVAVISCPTLTTQASTMLNDLGASVFLVVALRTVLHIRESHYPYRTVLLGAFIFCGGLSAKAPYAVAAAPAILIYLLFSGAVPEISKRIKLTLSFVAPCILVSVLWCLHTHVLTGNYTDLPVDSVAISRPVTGDVKALHNPTGLATMPNLSTVVMLPIMPFVTSIFGNQEPFGGRTGLIMCIWLPLLIWQFKKLDQLQKHYAWWLAAGSTLYYLEIGLLTPRTRYFCFTWAIWSTLSAAGFWLTYRTAPAPRRRFIAVAFCALCVLCCIDSIRTLLLYHEGWGYSKMMQLHWFQN